MRGEDGALAEKATRLMALRIDEHLGCRHPEGGVEVEVGKGRELGQALVLSAVRVQQAERAHATVELRGHERLLRATMIQQQVGPADAEPEVVDFELLLTINCPTHNTGRTVVDNRHGVKVARLPSENGDGV